MNAKQQPKQPAKQPPNQAHASEKQVSGDEIDQANAESFPASDPPSTTPPALVPPATPIDEEAAAAE